MIGRITVAALVMVVVVPGMLGFAASFAIPPIISQEVRIPIEDVETEEQIGGPPPSARVAAPAAFVAPAVVPASPPVTEPTHADPDCPPEDQSETGVAVIKGTEVEKQTVDGEGCKEEGTGPSGAETATGDTGAGDNDKATSVADLLPAAPLAKEPVDPNPYGSGTGVEAYFDPMFQQPGAVAPTVR